MALFQEMKDNEFNDLIKNGWLVAGVAAGTYKLSEAGLVAFSRLMETLPAKDRVLVEFTKVANAEQSVANVKGFMD